MPSTYHIFIFVQALTPKLNASPLAATVHTLVAFTTPSHQSTYSSQHSQPVNICSVPKQPSLLEMKLFLTIFVQPRQDLSHPVLTKQFLQLAIAAMMCMLQCFVQQRQKLAHLVPTNLFLQPATTATMSLSTCR